MLGCPSRWTLRGRKRTGHVDTPVGLAGPVDRSHPVCGSCTDGNIPAVDINYPALIDEVDVGDGLLTAV